MRFLPFDSITLQTKLKEEEVLKRLNQNIGATYLFKPNTDYGKPFTGKIEGNAFVIKRKINYRNSFRPVLHGTVEDNFTERVIKVTMRLTIYTMIFMAFWLGVVGIIALCFMFMIVANIRKADYSELFPSFIPVIMFIAGYLMTIISFNVEKKRAKEVLQEIFEAEIIK